LRITRVGESQLASSAILRASQILAPRMGSAHARTIPVALYTFYNIVKAAASYLAGALADRVNKPTLLPAGYLVSAVTCAGFVPERPTLPVLVVLFGLAGVHAGIRESRDSTAAANQGGESLELNLQRRAAFFVDAPRCVHIEIG
jgi:MFS family permease